MPECRSSWYIGTVSLLRQDSHLMLGITNKSIAKIYTTDQDDLLRDTNTRNYNKLHTEVLFSLEKVEVRTGVKRMHRRNSRKWWNLI